MDLLVKNVQEMCRLDNLPINISVENNSVHIDLGFPLILTSSYPITITAENVYVDSVTNGKAGKIYLNCRNSDYIKSHENLQITAEKQ